jgi:hypothetical protein
MRRAAKAYTLGELQAVYRLRKQSFLEALIGPFAILVGCAILGYFFSAYADTFRWWPFWEMLLIPLLAACWVLVGLWIVLAALLVRHARIFVYTDGLISYKTRATVVPWHELEGVWKNIKRDKDGVRRSYLLQYSNGTLLRLRENIIGIEKLGDSLEEAITRRFLHKAIATYNAGASILFDEISVNALGIGFKQEHKMVPWKKVVRVRIDDTSISISKLDEAGDWATARVADVPNVAVLQGLIEYALSHLPHIRLADTLALYATGQAVDFGALQVSQQGVFVQQSQVRLPWGEVASIGVGANEVIIRRSNPISLATDWYVIPLATVSNVPLLRDLVAYLMRENG